MYSVGDILGQKIGEIQSRLPYGVTIGSSGKPSNLQNRTTKALSTYNGTSNGIYGATSPNGDHMSFDTILKEVLETHRVNPSTYIPTYSATMPSIYDYNNKTNNLISNADYDSIIDSASSQYGVPTNVIRAVIMAESGFNPDVVSRAGAMGLMQLMPATARGLDVSNPFDPAENIDGGVRYLKHQLDRFGGNLDLALAAYNWGPNNIVKNNLTNLNDPAQFAKLPIETQNYIKKIRNYI